MPFPEANISVEEYLSFLMAREVIDGEITGVGTLSPVPLMGAILAHKTHAPDGKIFIFGAEGAALADGFKELFDIAQRGRLGLFFLSGAQIDRLGNLNLTCIGEYSSPKVRLPGGAGSGMLSFMARRTVLFTMNHDRRIFVKDLDFTTALGNDDYPWRTGRVTKVITPLCAFSYEPDEGQLLLESLHPGVSEDEVVANTGFEVILRETVTVSPSPDGKTIRTLRDEVIGETGEVYPEFAKKLRGKINRLTGSIPR